MTTAVRDAAELAELLRDASEPIRLAGRGTSLDRLPSAGGAERVSLRRLDRIVRLDPGDLTCTVEPGLPCAALDTALDAHALALPLPERRLASGGSIGGLFARGDFQSLAPGAPSTRALLLGLDGVLGDGTRFKSGARVVKSVAGFDLHKLFVGSRGRLFAATSLHLKLRPAPRARRTFVWRGLEMDTALQRFRRLRALAAPPAAIVFVRRPGDGFVVGGTIEGAPEHVAGVAGQLQLGAAGDEETPLPDWSGGAIETVDGTIRPSALPRLIAVLPGDAALWVSGTGQFRTDLAADDSDRLLDALADLPGGSGEIRSGADDRRGRATPLDRGAALLQDALKRALDPRDVLR